MSNEWKHPVESRVAAAWVKDLEASNVPKPHAFDTLFRFSGVMGCARAGGYTAAKVPLTDAMDGPSLAITGLGSEGHDKVQASFLTRYENAKVELPGQVTDLISGSSDIDDPDEDTEVEIKFVGGYKFLHSAGFKTNNGGKTNAQGEWVPNPPTRFPPFGPTLAHVCQGGFNARAHGRSKVRIVYISREAIAVGKARQLKLSSLERFTAEWLIEEDVWGPLVDKELVRLAKIRNIVEQGMLPDRVDLDDDGNSKPIPDTSKHWRCDYCPYRSRCDEDGPGRVKLR